MRARATVTQQRVAVMGVRSWLAFRAVCSDTRHGATILPGPTTSPETWMAPDTHDHWIDAALDAAAHNLEHHPADAAGPRFPPPSELLAPPLDEPLL